MRPMSEILKSPELLKLMKMELTSNVCKLHPYRTAKPIYKIIVDGEEVCPVCESEKMTDELSEIEDAKVRSAMGSRKYNLFTNSSILTDSGLYDASFTNYTDTEPEEVKNKQRAIDAFNNYKKGETFNTWLTGVQGAGKSHLAMSILRNLNEYGNKDKGCLFVSVEAMMLKIRDSFDNKESRYTEHYFVELLSSVDYLVLDDLGAETGATGTKKTASDFTLRVLYAISNSRQNKSTLVTTNLSRNELMKMYDAKLVSRLMKNTFLINFEETKDKRINNINF